MTARAPDETHDGTNDGIHEGIPDDTHRDARESTHDDAHGSTNDDHDPSLDRPAELADWREALEQRRFGAARRAFLAAEVVSEMAAKRGAPATQDDADASATPIALNALADVEELVRERSFAKAQERIRRLEAPAPIAPWDDLVADLERLGASAKSLDQRDPDAAVAKLKELGSTWFPAEVYTQLGTASIYDDRLDEARAHFEAALELDPDHYRALTNLGNVALEEGRVDDAIACYERALKLNDTFPNAHHNLGVAYRRKGQLHKSVRSLRTAQRAQQRQEATQARESLGRIGAGSGAKIIRWVVYAVVAVGLYLLLKNRGLF